MAKVTCVRGFASGKVGGDVFAVRNGVQIWRPYQPNVANPNTPAQVENRAKLKLLSQLSASIAGVIAIPKKGLVSSRNGFVSSNYQYTQYNDGAADIVLADMQLTKSAVGLAGFTADRTSGTAIHVELNDDMRESFSRIVYVVIRRMDSNTISPFASQVVSIPGDGGTFPCDLPFTPEAISIHAYGIKDDSAAATAAFGNLRVPSAEGVAEIITSRKVKESDVTISQTRGLYMAVGVDQNETSGAIYGNISVARINAAGDAYDEGGTVSGTGRFENGSSTTLVATANEGYQFLGWKDSRTGAYVSQNASMTVEVSGSKTYYAVFRQPGATHNVTLLPCTGVDAVAGVTGGGAYEAGDTVNVEFPAAASGTFLGWYNAPQNGVQQAANKQYSFTMGDTDRTLYYMFTPSMDEG